MPLPSSESLSENMELLNQNNVSLLDTNLYHQQRLKNSTFEEHYLKLREKEHRVWTIDELKTLPHVAKNSTHAREWSIRFRSAKKLLAYLESKKRPLTLLELGCGNGWLSHILSSSKNSTVVGLDVNLTELKQASQAFGNAENLTFVYGNVFDDILSKESFDIVILAASVQYFENLDKLSNRLFELLKKDGEIHIVDTPFYRNDEVLFAKKRSEEYFNAQGYAQMKNHYFHHAWEMLKEFKPEIIYDNRSIKNRILRKWFLKDLSPFPWIKIKKS